MNDLLGFFGELLIIILEINAIIFIIFSTILLISWIA